MEWAFKITSFEVFIRVFSNWPVVSWLIGSNFLIFSTLSPKRSIRTGSSSPGGYISIIPPRTEYSPGSRTVAVRSKPHSPRNRLNSSISIWDPALISRVNWSKKSGVGIRCKMAFTVEITITFLKLGACLFASLVKLSTRLATTSRFGETRS